MQKPHVLLDTMLLSNKGIHIVQANQLLEQPMSQQAGHAEAPPTEPRQAGHTRADQPDTAIINLQRIMAASDLDS